jgi:hypothetical protein
MKNCSSSLGFFSCINSKQKKLWNSLKLFPPHFCHQKKKILKKVNGSMKNSNLVSASNKVEVAISLDDDQK